MAANQMVVLIDGQEPTVAALTSFAVVNDGHFTAMQVRGGAVRGLDLHLDRLVTSHRRLYGTDLDPGHVRALMRAAVADRPDAYLRVTVAEHQPGTPSTMTVVRPPVEPDGTPVSLLPIPWSRGVAEVKHVGSFPQIHYAREAERAGYDDALFVAPAGIISETTVANVAFVDGSGALVWPDGPALPGVTWQLLDRALAASRQSRTATVTLDDLAAYSAALVTNSVGVAPVARIGDHSFPASRQAAARIASIYGALPTSPI